MNTFQYVTPRVVQCHMEKKRKSVNDTIQLQLAGLLFPGLKFEKLLNRNSLFYVSLTVLLSITLDNNQIDAQFFNTYITILYMYMFRAISYPQEVKLY
jgi:hypothetical protein